ncbi:MAG TPA: DUF190 domain-containing protein [Acidimicrobiales bacterium]|nr:DUF190 domain-containing protein [Acidimicrobiales bacterium]
MDADTAGTRLTIFLTEDDRVAHHPVYEVLLQRAREEGMAGATAWRAVEGYGRSGRIRTSRFPDTVAGLPVTVELIDEAERIEAFLEVARQLAPGAFAVREPVRVARRPRAALS